MNKILVRRIFAILLVVLSLWSLLFRITHLNTYRGGAATVTRFSEALAIQHQNDFPHAYEFYLLLPLGVLTLFCIIGAVVLIFWELKTGVVVGYDVRSRRGSLLKHIFSLLVFIVLGIVAAYFIFKAGYG